MLTEMMERVLELIQRFVKLTQMTKQVIYLIQRFVKLTQMMGLIIHGSVKVVQVNRDNVFLNALKNFMPSSILPIKMNLGFIFIRRCYHYEKKNVSDYSPDV